MYFDCPALAWTTFAVGALVSALIVALGAALVRTVRGKAGV